MQPTGSGAALSKDCGCSVAQGQLPVVVEGQKNSQFLIPDLFFLYILKISLKNVLNWTFFIMSTEVKVNLLLQSTV